MNNNAVTAGVKPPAIYPVAIQRAVSLLDEIDMFRAVPDGFWPVLVRLVKKINVSRPSSPITARRETLASEVGKSVETVNRALKYFESKGIICREKKAARDLRGSHSPIVFAKHAIHELIIAPASRGKAASPCVKTDTSISKEVHSLKNQSIETCDQLPTGESPKQSQKVRFGTKTVPADLVWLVTSRKLEAGMVCMLMGWAKKAGKRLSDLVAVCRPNLQGLEGKSLIAYVRKLLTQDKDWAWLNKEQTDTVQIVAKQERDKALLARKIEEWHGRKFVAKDGRVFQIEHNGFYTVFDGRVSRTGRVDIAMVEAVTEGRLRPQPAAGFA